MPTAIHTLSTNDELDRALARSSQLPIVIFNHSPTCGISAQAFESIREWLATAPPAAEFFVVPVQASRALSTAVAKMFGIRHESPQALVIDDGRVVWHGSHFRATATSIAAALEKLAAAT
ncbi:MAG: bacillithiol system redox-active protein YtxJ [Vicinamibacterales bacterium]